MIMKHDYWEMRFPSDTWGMEAPDGGKLHAMETTRLQSLLARDRHLGLNYYKKKPQKQPLKTTKPLPCTTQDKCLLKEWPNNPRRWPLPHTYHSRGEGQVKQRCVCTYVCACVCTYIRLQINGSRPCSSQCGLPTSSSGIAWGLVRNAEYWAHPKLTRSESALYQAHQAIRTHSVVWETQA